jgi:hypothetical protein
MKKIGTKKGLARLVVQIGAKTVNSSAFNFTAMWAGECPTQQLFEAIWKPILPKFSFIIILLISQSSFLSALSLPQNEFQSF